jgi:hypothetical protein
LNHAIHHVGDAQPPLPASGLRQPDPANVAGPIASRQQGMAQRGEERRGILLRFHDRLSVHSRCPLVAYHLEQRLRQIGRRRYLLEQPTGVDRTGDGSCRFLGLRCMQQEGAPAGCVRRAPLPAPLRAGGESEAQLTVTRPSQSISPFAPPAFTGFHATTKRSDFCMGVGRSSLPPSGLPLGIPGACATR